MRPAAELDQPQSSTSGKSPGRRAAVWTLSICAAVAVMSVAFSLFPSGDEPSTEAHSPLSVTGAEELMFFGSIAVLVAIVYVVLYVCFRLRSRARNPR